MNQDIKRRWVEALRSGKYPQGPGRLAGGGKYCCLGVLCEIAVGDGVICRSDTSERDFFRYGTEMTAQYLPASVQRWAGLERLACPMDPEITIMGRWSHLASFNDEGYTFAEIADGIEGSL